MRNYICSRKRSKLFVSRRAFLVYDSPNPSVWSMSDGSGFFNPDILGKYFLQNVTGLTTPFTDGRVANANFRSCLSAVTSWILRTLDFAAMPLISSRMKSSDDKPSPNSTNLKFPSVHSFVLSPFLPSKTRTTDSAESIGLSFSAKVSRLFVVPLWPSRLLPSMNHVVGFFPTTSKTE